jgi:hypothetical protein
MTSEQARALAAKRVNPGRKRFAQEEEIKAALRKAIPESEVLAALAVACRRREPGAIALYLGYLWGKPTDRVEVSGPDGGPIEHASLSDAELEREILAATARAGNGAEVPLVPPCASATDPAAG